MPDSALKIEVITSAPFDENCYIAFIEGRQDALVFDPGMETDRILECIDSHGLEPAAILCTHGHIDHIAGNADLKDRWPDCPLVIGSGDAEMLTDPMLNLSGGYGFPVVSPPADKLVDEPDTYEAAGISLKVYDVPGHSPGHVMFVWRGGSPAIVFGGDVLFQGSIGRTDFPNGDFDTLRASIHDKLFTLPDDTIVLPGHGPPTTVGEEKRTNPFVGKPAGYVC